MTVSAAKGAKAKADRLFSKLIRSRGHCENCGQRPPDVQLQCAHILSRRYALVRTDERNAYCLCAGCHFYFTDHPVAFGQFVLERIGDAGYQALVERATSGAKPDYEGEAQRLKDRLKGAA